MQYWKSVFWLVGLLFIFLVSCNEEEPNIPDVSHIEVDLKIRRLEQDLFQLENKEDILSFLNDNPRIAEEYFRRSQHPHDSILVERIHKFLSYDFNDTLYSDTQIIFGDFEKQKEELKQAFQFIKYYYPEFEEPEIVTMISGFGNFGFGQAYYRSKNADMIIIGLDYYAGPEATYRPADYPSYVLRRYQPQYIVPHVVTFLSDYFSKDNLQDQSLLADMIFYGKAYYFANQILPYTPDSLVLGYSIQQLAESNQHQDIIWAHFIENDLFYVKDRRTKNRYLAESPKIDVISPDCPGRIGRWLGWEIVKAYARKNEVVNLREIMGVSNSQQLFQKSGYKPKI